MGGRCAACLPAAQGSRYRNGSTGCLLACQLATGPASRSNAGAGEHGRFEEEGGCGGGGGWGPPPASLGAWPAGHGRWTSRFSPTRFSSAILGIPLRPTDGPPAGRGVWSSRWWARGRADKRTGLPDLSRRHGSWRPSQPTSTFRVISIATRQHRPCTTPSTTHRDLLPLPVANRCGPAGPLAGPPPHIWLGAATYLRFRWVRERAC